MSKGSEVIDADDRGDDEKKSSRPDQHSVSVEDFIPGGGRQQIRCWILFDVFGTEQRLPQVEDTGGAFVWMHGQGLEDGPFGSRRYSRIQLAQRIEQPRFKEALSGILWGRAGEQVIERGADAVDIGADICVAGVAAILFERGIGNGAPPLDDGHCASVVRLQHFDEPEVNQFQSIFGRDLYVARLDVSVEHGRVLAVQVFQGVQELSGPEEDLGFGEMFMLSNGFIYDFLQITAFDEIHDQVLAAIYGEVVGDFGEVGMIEPGEDAGLLIELFDRLTQVQFGPALVDEEGRQDFFDRADSTVQAQIVSLVNCTHSTLTYKANDFITPAQD